MDQLLAVINDRLPAGLVAHPSYGPSVIEVPVPDLGGVVLFAVEHNGPFWEAVLDRDGDQSELPDGPRADAPDRDVVAYVAQVVAGVTCRA